MLNTFPITDDILFKYIIHPHEENLLLWNLSLVCKDLRKRCHDEALRRLAKLDSMIEFRSILDWNEKIYVFLKNVNQLDAWQIEAKKINEFLESFNKTPLKFFSYVSSPSSAVLKQKMTIAAKKGLLCLEQQGSQGTKEFFYCQTSCTEERRPHVFDLLETCEMSYLQTDKLQAHTKIIGGSHTRILIDISQSCLPVGNMVAFSTAQKKFSIDTGRLNLQRFGHPKDFRNSSGHINIALYNPSFSAETFSPQVPSSEPVLFEECKNQMSLLKDLSFLEIMVMTDYDKKMRSCFQKLLEGTEDLVEIEGAAFHFYHILSDEHMEDLLKFTKIHMSPQKSIKYLYIKSSGITSEQLIHFIKEIDNKRHIQLDIEVPDSRYNHLYHSYELKNVTLCLGKFYERNE